MRGRGGSSGGGPNSGIQDSAASSAPKRPRLQQTLLADCPYSAWSTYFPDESYGEVSATVTNVRAFANYFQSRVQLQHLDGIEAAGALSLDYEELVKDAGVLHDLPSIASAIRDQPEATLNAAALALHTVLEKCYKASVCVSVEDDANASGDDMELTEESLPSFELPRLFVRLFNYHPVLPLKQLKAPQFGKFVAVNGTVVRVSNVKPLVTKLAFECAVCAERQVIMLQDGKYKVPTRCVSDECRSRSFTPLRGSQLTETIDWQSVRLQEVVSDDSREAGRIPRTVECELTGDLVDACVPGDTVTVTAIVKATGSEESHGKNNKDKCMFLLYLQAVSVCCNSRSSDDTSDPQLDFSTNELYGIKEIQGDRDVFRLIVGSLCPTIFGQEVVKAGLVLGLFGGSTKHSLDKNSIPVRADPHVLVVGDPGLGKSQLLQAAANVAPRGVYVCGNTTTTSGLTVTLTKDGSGSGDYALEAGALVLGDRGCCCIDEFDKMTSQHQALLEAMEQQSISLAKAGIICSLPARTSILAAANPVGGHYNKAKTVSENLKMGSALLSRFDLVFILLDKPDEERDQLLSEHVMLMHYRRSAGQAATARRVPGGSIEVGTNSQPQDTSRIFCNTSISDRLKLPPGEIFDPIPHQLLRKYIAYARTYVHPKLSSKAAQVLQEFYLHLRRQRQGPNATPITTRQLESLIRLAEARARIELHEVVSEQDARDVVEIMKFSMYDAFSDEFGQVDFQRSQNGAGMSCRSQAKRFIAELNRIADTTFNSLFSVPQMKDIARKMGLQVSSLDDLLSSLNNQGYLLKKGPRMYQLQTSNCL